MAGLRTIATALALVAAPVAGFLPADAHGEPRVQRTVEDSRIIEASGLAVSHHHDRVLYTHNDSGYEPRFFAIGRDGRTVATFRLADTQARDWEAMAAGRDEDGRPVLYIADIGDNLGGAWDSVSVYRVREPRELRDATLRATRFRFRYADGARNAEALLVHPRTGRLYVASREWHGGMYAAPKRLRTDAVNVLRRVGDAPSFVTGGAFAPDGGRLVLRTYFSASVYAEPGGREVGQVSLPDQPQGESVAYRRDGRSLLVGSEGEGSGIWEVPLSTEQSGRTPGPTSGSVSPSPRAEDAPDGSSGYGVWALALAVLAAALLIRKLRSRGDR